MGEGERGDRVKFASNLPVLTHSIVLLSNTNVKSVIVEKGQIVGKKFRFRLYILLENCKL